MTDSKSYDETDLDLLRSAFDSSSPLTLLDDFSTVGMIADNAPHWQIEPFLPLDDVDLRDMLSQREDVTGRGGDPTGDQRVDGGRSVDDRSDDDGQKMSAADWDRLLGRIDRHLDNWSGLRMRRLIAAYRPCDPDRRHHRSAAASEDQSTEHPSPQHPSPAAADRVASEIQQLAIAAGYSVVPRDQIEQCVGVASHWGVPLNIDFSAFERLDVYARGDVIGYRMRRNMRSLYRRRTVEVPVYRRMVVAFEMKGDAKYIEPSPDDEAAANDADQMHAPPRCVHLRLFKNIPKQDVDMLLPTARVRISGIDRLKIVLPSLGGFLMSLRKIAQFTLLLAALALHWVAILIAIIVGYLIKTSLSYFQTRNRYQLNLTKHLYFQKLGAGELVLTSLVQQAVAQRRVEAMLAYYGLAMSDEAISTRRLKRRCQRYVREGLELEIEFRVDRALTLLVDAGLATRSGDGWQLCDRHRPAFASSPNQRSSTD